MPGPSIIDAKMAAHDSLIDRLSHHAAVSGDHDAIVTPTFTLSYSQLLGLVQAQAGKFENAGISADSVVGICCADDPKHLVLCLAAVYLGSTSVTIPSHETADMQSRFAGLCGTTHAVDQAIAIAPASPESFIDRVPIMAPAVVAKLLFATSGTTGVSKLVVHHDSDLVAQAYRHIESRQERFACLAAMEHNFVKRHRLYCVATGATNVFLEARPDNLVQQCRSLALDVLHVSAFQAQELLAIANISELRGIRLKLGGSHVPGLLRQQLREKVSGTLQAGYGTTETGAIAFTDPDDANAGESVGRPLPGIEVQAVTSDRVPVANGETGELAVRCEGMFREYLKNPDLTTARLDKGWFYTGDIGYLDEEQRIHLRGRLDDMFVFNSMNIYPQDIEATICRHPDVADAAVLPKRSAVHGDIPVALIVFNKNTEPDLYAVEKFVRRLVGMRCPRQFTRVDEIPRNATGKIMRTDAGGLLSKSTQVRRNIVHVVNAGQSNRLKPAAGAAFIAGAKDIRFGDIDLDSLARMNLMVMLEVEYGVLIRPVEFLKLGSLGDVCSVALSQDGVEQMPEFSASEVGDAATGPLSESYLARFFRRVLHHCHTVAQFYKALATLSHRLTPIQVAELQDAHREGRLISSGTPKKYQDALNAWLDAMHRMMSGSGKERPEPFVSHRIAPTAMLFSGPGAAVEKTLLVCFPGAGDRHLLMPNAVFLQHTDAATYDVLMLAEPLKEGYRLGVPMLGRNITEVVERIGRLPFIGNYNGVRTFGCSAGGHAAVIAAYLLRAELGVSVGGRFHSERYPRKILERLFAMWRAVHRGDCHRLLLSYATDKTRDRNFARITGWLTGGSLVAVELSDDYVGHLILRRLVERRELAPYLARTIFAGIDDEGKRGHSAFP